MPRSWLGRWARKAGRHTIPAETPDEDTLRRHLGAEAERTVTDDDPGKCWFCQQPGGQPCKTSSGKIRAETHKGRGRP